MSVGYTQVTVTYLEDVTVRSYSDGDIARKLISR